MNIPIHCLERLLEELLRFMSDIEQCLQNFYERQPPHHSCLEFTNFFKSMLEEIQTVGKQTITKSQLETTIAKVASTRPGHEPFNDGVLSLNLPHLLVTYCEEAHSIVLTPTNTELVQALCCILKKVFRGCTESSISDLASEAYVFSSEVGDIRDFIRLQLHLNSSDVGRRYEIGLFSSIVSACAEECLAVVRKTYLFIPGREIVCTSGGLQVACKVLAIFSRAKQISPMLELASTQFSKVEGEYKRFSVGKSYKENGHILQQLANLSLGSYELCESATTVSIEGQPQKKMHAMIPYLWAELLATSMFDSVFAESHQTTTVPVSVLMLTQATKVLCRKLLVETWISESAFQEICLDSINCVHIKDSFWKSSFHSATSFIWEASRDFFDFSVLLRLSLAAKSRADYVDTAITGRAVDRCGLFDCCKSSDSTE